MAHLANYIPSILYVFAFVTGGFVLMDEDTMDRLTELLFQKRSITKVCMLLIMCLSSGALMQPLLNYSDPRYGG